MTGCPQTAHTTEPLGKVYFTYFDTVSYIYSYAGDSQENFDENTAIVASTLEEYHRLFDIYYEHSGVNNLCTLNKNAGGEMNVMMGAVLRPWHDCRTAASSDPANATIPDAAILEEAAKHTSIDLLEIDEANSTVRISDPEASIDVGALGKGYATEKAAQALEAKGVTSYVLNIGGNIRIIGTKTDGTGWLTGIKDPANSDSAYIEYINIANTSCVTSGIYERFFTVDGVRYHHIIDKDTLMPSAYFPSVTVITKDSGLADALSTALFTMSYEDGLKLVSSIGGVEVLWVTESGEKLMTDGFKLLVTEKN